MEKFLSVCILRNAGSFYFIILFKKKYSSNFRFTSMLIEIKCKIYFNFDFRMTKDLFYVHLIF